jgi:hypothetical protein
MRECNLFIYLIFSMYVCVCVFESCLKSCKFILFAFELNNNHGKIRTKVNKINEKKMSKINYLSTKLGKKKWDIVQ